MSLPIHRWFRYTAGFSSQWVMSEIKKIMKNNKADSLTVLDPFAGSGTTLLTCDEMGIKSIGLESHPFVSKIAKTKLLWNTDIQQLHKYVQGIVEVASNDRSPIDEYPDIVYKCYDDNNLNAIDHLKKALISNKNNSNEYKLTWLAFVSILRCSSQAGTASWQYILPNKSKARVKNAVLAFEQQISMMIEDIRYFQLITDVSRAKLYEHDARLNFPIDDKSIDAVITSPPYANNYDYADATRLELSVLGDVRSWSDLQNVVRPNLVRSCTQMVSSYKKDTYKYLDDPLLDIIHSDIKSVVSKMDAEKELHGGKKNYHTMITLYFLDLARVWKNLRRVCKDGSKICFVVGDSAPYGIYVPVDEWLGKLAISAGFKKYSFEKIRDRNIKWKNRKHNVPLKEGYLWVEG